MKPLIIVESPSKAKTISKYLEGAYEVMSTIGHIKQLPRERLSVDIENDFAIEDEIIEDKKKLVNELKKISKSAPEVIIATDSDREGEAIAADIASEIDKSKISRVQFTEITKQGVQTGLEERKEIDNDLVKAATTRRIVDRLFGYKISPVLWSTLQSNMNFVKVNLSAGRVQSAALKILIDRERLRQKFIPAIYFDLKADFEIDKDTFSATLFKVDEKRIASGKDFDPFTGKLNNDKVFLLTENQGNELLKKLEAGDWVIEDIEEKVKNSNPKPPFTTSTLQQEAARKLRFSARKTMRTAQTLYEQGFITYMRTDSTALSDEGMASARKQIEDEFGKEYLPEKGNVYSTKVKNAQEAHEAIRPSGSKFPNLDKVKKSTDDDAANLYDLILKRTLASQMKPAKINQVTVTIINNRAEFRANGKIILFPGYMAAYVESTDSRNGNNESKENILPKMEKKQSLSCSSLEANEHSTKPPARFTEASLVKELEEKGIGRPSTFANIIDTIVKRTYAARASSKLTPTFLGLAVTQLLENHFNSLVDSKFTATMEDGLDAISRGEIESLPFMKDFYFGSKDQNGLSEMLDEKIDIGKACSVQLVDDEDPIEVRVGQYGPFLRQGDNRKSVPADIYFGDLTLEKVQEILDKEISEDRELGIDPKTNEMILLKNGPYGPYVQLGETSSRKAIPKGTDVSDVDVNLAQKLLALPRVLGVHPETNEEVKADYGRFGPYVTAGKGKNGRIPPQLSPLTIELDEALELIAKRSSGPQELKNLGNHTTTGEALLVKDGRYGPYVTDGKVNASIPSDIEAENITLEEAVGLIDKKRSAPPRKKRARRKKSK